MRPPQSDTMLLDGCPSNKRPPFSACSQPFLPRVVPWLFSFSPTCSPALHSKANFLLSGPSILSLLPQQSQPAASISERRKRRKRSTRSTKLGAREGQEPALTLLCQQVALHFWDWDFSKCCASLTPGYEEWELLDPSQGTLGFQLLRGRVYLTPSQQQLAAEGHSR